MSQLLLVMKDTNNHTQQQVFIYATSSSLFVIFKKLQLNSEDEQICVFSALAPVSDCFHIQTQYNIQRALCHFSAKCQFLHPAAVKFLLLNTVCSFLLC